MASKGGHVGRLGPYETIYIFQYIQTLGEDKNPALQDGIYLLT
jgi:hypothetical protein